MKLTGFLSLLFLTSNLLAQDLPVPPQGFQWERCPEIKGAFLRPDRWHFKRELEKGTYAFFISKEEIKPGGEFKTGVTINVVPGVDKKDKAAPLLGKSATWIAPGKQKTQIKGKISATHGNKGALRVIFEKGLPGQSLGQEVKIE